MTKIQLDLTRQEKSKVERLKHKFKLNSKIETIRKIIRDFKEDEK